MQKKVLAIFLILLVLGLGAYMVLKYGPAKDATSTPSADDNVPNVSTDIIWNAYTFNGSANGSTANSTAFIYPSDWIFEEVADTTNPKNIIGFKVSYPISSNSLDRIEAGGPCPEVMIPEIHSACINTIWLHTQSENPVVLKVFEDMKVFANK